MKVTKVTLYKSEDGKLFEKVSPSSALEVDNAVKAIEGEGDAAKKFFVVPTTSVAPAVAK